MATTTATILIGQNHPNHSGINPTHIIRFTENSRPALILQSFTDNEENIVVIPSVNFVDDIYLMISVFILKKVAPSKDLLKTRGGTFYEDFQEQERFSLYEETKKVITNTNIKVVFNILDGSSLLNFIDVIKSYPNDFEVTMPTLKKGI